MKINTKYIFLTDSKKEIIEKINYNFSQIISFGRGSKGIMGDKGLIGKKGPSNFKGDKGISGERGTEWYKQNNEPDGSINLDLWIDTKTTNYDVFQKINNTWINTNYSLLNSQYLKTYDSIGFGSVLDKYVIGIKDNINSSDISFIISDFTTNINTNNSKVIIISDNMDVPIFGFNKSTNASLFLNGFFWKDNNQSNTDIILKSNKNIDIIGGKLDLSSNNNINFNCIKGSINSINNITIRFSIGGTGGFKLLSDINGGISINSSNFTINPYILQFNKDIKIYPNLDVNDKYVLSLTKKLPINITKSTSGIELINDNGNDIFNFIDDNENIVFSSKTKNGDKNHGHVKFGHESSRFYVIEEVTKTTQTTKKISSKNIETKETQYIEGVLDITNPQLYITNNILLTPLIKSSGSYYIKIPTFSGEDGKNINVLSNIGSLNTYTIYFDDSDTTSGIGGIAYDYYNYMGSVYNLQTNHINFSNLCKYIELTYLSATNQMNSNPIVMWIDSNGRSGKIQMSNKYNKGTLYNKPNGLDPGDFSFNFDDSPLNGI